MTVLEFKTRLSKFVDEAEALQKKENELKAEVALHQQNFFGFLKESGVPENFTLPQLMRLAASKSIES